MSKRNLIVTVNGVNAFDAKFTEEEAALMITNMGDSFVANIGDLEKRFGYTETYTKETVADGVFKYTFVVNGKYEYYIYLAGTAEMPNIPEHKFNASIFIKELGKELICVLCDTKEALDFYKEMTEKSIAEYYEKEGMGEINMKYSA